MPAILKFQVEVLWSGRIYYQPVGEPKETLTEAAVYANQLRNGGYRKALTVRITDDNGWIVWCDGQVTGD